MTSLLCPRLLWAVPGWLELLISPAFCVRGELVLMQFTFLAAFTAQAVLLSSHRIWVSCMRFSVLIPLTKDSSGASKENKLVFDCGSHGLLT